MKKEIQPVTEYKIFTIHTKCMDNGSTESIALINGEPVFGTFSELDQNDSLAKMKIKIDKFILTIESPIKLVSLTSVEAEGLKLITTHYLIEDSPEVENEVPASEYSLRYILECIDSVHDDAAMVLDPKNAEELAQVENLKEKLLSLIGK